MNDWSLFWLVCVNVNVKTSVASCVGKWFRSDTGNGPGLLDFMLVSILTVQSGVCQPLWELHANTLRADRSTLFERQYYCLYCKAVRWRTAYSNYIVDCFFSKYNRLSEMQSLQKHAELNFVQKEGLRLFLMQHNSMQMIWNLKNGIMVRLIHPGTT